MFKKLFVILKNPDTFVKVLLKKYINGFIYIPFIIYSVSYTKYPFLFNLIFYVTY